MDELDALEALAELASRYTGPELGARVRTALSDLEELDDAQLGQLAQALAHRPPAPDGGSGEGEGPAAYFATLPEFVDGWLLPTYRRSVRGHEKAWCPRWWEHAEAVSRLDALWRAWELLRLDGGTGMSVWWRDHADHHLAVLLDADGPFKRCHDGHSDTELEQLPSDPPPDWMFARDHLGLPAEPVDAAARRQPAAAVGTNGISRVR